MHAREPTPCWRENVVAVVILLRVLLSWWRKQTKQAVKWYKFYHLAGITEICVLTLVVKKSTMKLSAVSVLDNRRENLKLNVVFVVVLVLESKAL